MDVFFTTIIVGISLSMDAFSLALIYGMQNISKKDKITLSLIVGLYHFFMPLIGLKIGSLITDIFLFNLNILVSIIFFLIGIEMIISSLKETKDKIMLNIVGFLIFGLSVSIDSLTTGIGLNIINNNYLQVALTFALISSLFTYLGLTLGYKLNEKVGKYSTTFGGIVLIILGIHYLF